MNFRRSKQTVKSRLFMKITLIPLVLLRPPKNFLLLWLILLPLRANASISDAEYYIENKLYNAANTALDIARAAQPTAINDLFQIGIMYCKIGQIQKSIDTYTSILQKMPHSLSVLYNIGYALKTAGQADKALTTYRTILQRNPHHEAAHMGVAFTLLQSGDYKNGWHEHQWNLEKQGKSAPQLKQLIANNTVAGKITLLTPEGGLGDSINFIRYARRLKNMGAHVAVAVQQPLHPLFALCPYIDLLCPPGTLPRDYDAHATLMTVPSLFGDTEDDIPNEVPYLYADPELINYWHQQLQHDTNFKIGICWQADAHNDTSRLPIAHRGISLTQFFKLKNIPGITFYSLQKYEGLDQLNDAPTDFNLVTFDSLDNEHGAFMDTAAIMHEMNLIISVDTATAHLAGALGRPVWLLLPYATDWRWLFNRTDSPWYPTMHIFKQQLPFDWNGVMQHIKAQLLQLIEEHQ